MDSSGSSGHRPSEAPGQSSSEMNAYEVMQSKLEMAYRDKPERMGRSLDKPSSSSQQGVSISSSGATSGKGSGHPAGTPPHHDGLSSSSSSSSRYSGGSDQPASSSVHQLDQSEDGGSSSAPDTGLSPSSSSIAPLPHPRKRAIGRPGRASGRGDDLGPTSGVASSSSSGLPVGGQGGGSGSAGAKPGVPSSGQSAVHPSSSSSLSSASSRDRGSTQQGRDSSNLPESSSRGVASAHKSGGAGDKTGRLSAYDFPDDPDEETPSSYMALSASGRGARKCPVDSSEGKGQGWPAGTVTDSSQPGDDGKPPGEKSEAQGFETFADSGSEVSGMGPGKPRARFGARVGSVEAAADPGVPVDSSTKNGQEEAGDSVDSSTSVAKSGGTGKQRGGGPRGSAHDSTSISAQGDSSSTEVSQGTGDPTGSSDSSLAGSSAGFGGAGQWRVSGRPDSASGEDSSGTVRTSVISSSDPHPDSLPPPSSSASSSLGGYSAGGQPVVSSMIRDPDQQSGGAGTTTTTMCSRDQEPAPLLSSQYETLSDDDD